MDRLVELPGEPAEERLGGPGVLGEEGFKGKPREMLQACRLDRLGVTW